MEDVSSPAAWRLKKKKNFYLCRHAVFRLKAAFSEALKIFLICRKGFLPIRKQRVGNIKKFFYFFQQQLPDRNS